MNDLNFLKLIYELGGDTHNVSNGDIAKKSNLSNASVTERTRHLSDTTSYLTYKRYYGTKLTSDGINKIKPYIQQQRLLEVWLVNELGSSLDFAYEEAGKLTNQVDTNFIDKLNSYLDRPQHCPHGNVIPNNNGESTDHYYLLTDNFDFQDVLTIESFTEDSTIIGMLETIDIRIHDQISVLDFVDDTLIILNKRTNTKQLLPKSLADSIRVKKTNPVVID
ncbi:metal-dependent transcriptional regulator [Companilactobacillus hulinensis]|uniref:metal-dependent transcriptional regulator n=1 Tax=Companilactobacillus hulinensis TaxID=2486007 RepID=UPI000F779830|nr:metal-dependent transcriptional regulator [Companilactobacillus hulinensis]